MRVEFTHIHYLLARWGRRSLRQASGGLGYAKMSMIMGAHPGEGNHDPAPPPDVSPEDFDVIEAAVMTLPVDQIGAIVRYYIHGSGRSLRRVARDAGMDHKTLGRRILAAHRALNPILNKEST